MTTALDTQTVLYDRHYENGVDFASSALNDIWYARGNDGEDLHLGDLYVKFPSGVVAGYSNVSSEELDDLVTAYSVGSYYSSNIRGYYNGLNGDVNLVPRNATVEVSDTTPATVSVPKAFTVLVDVQGTIRFDLDAGNLEEAIGRVKAILDTAVVDAKTEVIKVTRL
jgi:hypothetical protein